MGGLCGGGHESVRVSATLWAELPVIVQNYQKVEVSSLSILVQP